MSERIGAEFVDVVAPRRPSSTRRLVAVLGTATALAQLGQLLWLVAGSRSLPRTTFGAVLAAQALYGVLQIVVDSGAAFHGARLAAAQTLDAPKRASLVRIRLQLAAAAAVVTFAVGLAGGWISLQANAPFAAALVLWALFNYWEPYGLGDARPMSVYLVLASGGAGRIRLCVSRSWHNTPRLRRRGCGMPVARCRRKRLLPPATGRCPSSGAESSPRAVAPRRSRWGSGDRLADRHRVRDHFFSLQVAPPRRPLHSAFP